MKCIYAIPIEAVDIVSHLCREYADELESYSNMVVAKSDELRETVENVAGPVFQLDDDDWDSIGADLTFADSENTRDLPGEIFWARDDAMAAAKVLEKSARVASKDAANWLLGQVERNRSFVLLAK